MNSEDILYMVYPMIVRNGQVLDPIETGYLEGPDYNLYTPKIFYKKEDMIRYFEDFCPGNERPIEVEKFNKEINQELWYIDCQYYPDLDETEHMFMKVHYVDYRVLLEISKHIIDKSVYENFIIKITQDNN